MTMLRVLLFTTALLAATAAHAQQCAAPLPPSPKPTGASYSPPVSPLPQPGDAVLRLTTGGAELSHYSDYHGYEVGIAHTKGQMLVYFAPADHKVVLSGTIIPVPYDTLRKISGDRAHDLNVYDSIRGFFVQNGTHFQTIYSTPDGQASLAAQMWDASGQDLTRHQIKGVPGAVPTIRIDVPPERTGAPVIGMNRLIGGEIGDPKAPEAIMFIDPQCMYSIKAMTALKPSVDAGRIRLKIVPLSLLDYEDQGASTINAKSMLSFPADEMANAWIHDHLNQHAAQPVPDADSYLQQNMAVAHDISLRGTPTFLWKHKNGELGRLDGAPRDVDTFVASVSQ